MSHNFLLPVTFNLYPRIAPPTPQIQNALEQLVKTYKTKEDEFQKFQKEFNIQVSL